MCKVSVVVACYNVEKYLESCFDVLRRQTLDDMEFVFVDDGSTRDATAQILDEYAAREPRARVIHQENKGLGEARNAGILASKGEYIGFFDPDDTLSDNFFELLYDTAVRHDADVAWTNLLRCYPSNPAKNRYLTKFYSEQVLEDRQSRFSALGKSCYVVTKVYRRSFLVTPDKHLLFDRAFYEDLMFTARVMDEANRVVAIDGAVYNYIYVPSSITARRPDRVLERHFYESRKEIRSFMIQRGIEVPRKWRHIRIWSWGIGNFSILKAKDFGRYNLVRLFDFIPVWISFNRDFGKQC